MGKTFWGKLLRWARYLSGLQVPLYAAHAGFFIVLSLLPLLVLFLSLLRYTGLDIRTLTDALEGVVPGALLPAAKDLILSTYRNTTGAVVSVSVLSVLWSAGRGIYGLMEGLNHIYGVEENRGYFRTRAVSVVYTVLFLLVLLLTLVLNVFGASVLRWFPLDAIPFFAEVVDLRFFLLLLLQTVLFTAIYTVLPNRHGRLRDALPGALLAALGWLVFSDLYSVYVTRFAGLSHVYGPVYAVALSMLWLYCCVCIVFYGGALNRQLAGQ